MSPCRPWVRADDGPITDSWARGFHLKDPTIQYTNSSTPVGFFSPLRFHTDIGDDQFYIAVSFLSSKLSLMSDFNIRFAYEALLLSVLSE